MDYKQKYEKALAKAKEYIDVDSDNTLQVYARGVMEYLFPELEESKDDKIRKAILELVRQSSEILEKKNQEQMIAWLEKQDKQKPADKVEPKFKAGN